MTTAGCSIDIDTTSKLYKLVLSHIAKDGKDGNGRLEASIAPAKGKRKQQSSCCGVSGDCSLTDAPSSNERIALVAGFGEFLFVDFHNNAMIAKHNIIGKPVGTQCNATVYTALTVSCEGGKEKLVSFFHQLVVKSEESTEGFIQIYHWHNKYRYWNASLRIKARPLESVILPAKTTTAILEDFDAFTAQETQGDHSSLFHNRSTPSHHTPVSVISNADFYSLHGIPYRRSYLFYGVPGAGKTSCIQAIAGAYKRSVAYLNIDPEMTDDGLRSAMDDLPEETIVVLEDVDALFTKDRQAKQPKSTLTFTGLLNALDGVGSSMGQLFILTTNLREQLDSALIRNGRVDMQVFFDYANDEQIVKMWNMFYPPNPTDTNLAEEFCQALRTKLDGKTIAPCALQHFFVSQRTKTAQEALGNVDSLMEDLKAKEVEDSKTKEAITTEKNKKEGKGDNEEKDGDDDDDDDDDEKKKAKGKENDLMTSIHIHFHGVDGTTTTPSTTTVVASAESSLPVITTTATADSSSPATASKTANVMGVNNCSFTVTITSSSGIPIIKEAALSNTNEIDDKIVDKNSEIIHPSQAVVAQAIDETKTA